MRALSGLDSVTRRVGGAGEAGETHSQFSLNEDSVATLFNNSKCTQKGPDMSHDPQITDAHISLLEACGYYNLGLVSPRDRYWVRPASCTLLHEQYGHDRTRWYTEASDEVEIFALLFCCLRYVWDADGRAILGEAKRRMTSMFPSFDLTRALRVTT